MILSWARPLLRLGIGMGVAWLAVAEPARAADPAPTPDADLALVASRLKARYLAERAPDAAASLASQNPDGSWSDVDYADLARGPWKPIAHLQRVKGIAIAYAKEGGPLFRSPAALQGIARGLAFWRDRKPASDNWWFVQIGQQLELEPIVILAGNDLPADVLQPMLDLLLDPMQVEPGTRTGQNLNWICGEQIVRGVMRKSPHDVAAASEALQGAIAVTEGEGIQADASFHQHGAQLYNGGYGIAFLNDATGFAEEAQGTRFAFSPEKIGLLSRLLLDGTGRMVRGSFLDPSVIGRDITRTGGSAEGHSLGAVAQRLAALDPARKADLEAFQAAAGGGEPAPFMLGNKYFWRSDFMSHQRKGFYASVKMNSARTVGTELVNGENPCGYWLPFGVTFIERRGDEHIGIFPFWDWKRLPGTTATREQPGFPWGFHQPGTAVGGVSDGVYGAAAMSLELDPNPSLHARKAWFFFDDEFVALGSDITSPGALPVDTTVNQALLKGDVVVDGTLVPQGEREMKGVSWVLHDGVGYVFPGGADIGLANTVRQGDWKTISQAFPSTPASGNVFTLWIPHGPKPSGAAYRYVVVPGTDAEKMAAYAAKPPVRIVADTPDLQAVRHDTLGIAAAVFYAPGETTIRKGLSVRADQPCLLLLDESKIPARLTAAPLGPVAGVNVSLTGREAPMAFSFPPGTPSQAQTVALPTVAAN